LSRPWHQQWRGALRSRNMQVEHWIGWRVFLIGMQSAVVCAAAPCLLTHAMSLSSWIWVLHQACIKLSGALSGSSRTASASCFSRPFDRVATTCVRLAAALLLDTYDLHSTVGLFCTYNGPDAGKYGWAQARHKTGRATPLMRPAD
jgi:hypothetical protein